MRLSDKDGDLLEVKPEIVSFNKDSNNESLNEDREIKQKSEESRESVQYNQRRNEQRTLSGRKQIDKSMTKYIKLTPHYPNKDKRYSMKNGTSRSQSRDLTKDIIDGIVMNEMSIIIEPNEPIVPEVYEPSQKYTMVFSRDENNIGDESYLRNYSRESVDLSHSLSRNNQV